MSKALLSFLNRTLPLCSGRVESLPKFERWNVDYSQYDNVGISAAERDAGSYHSREKSGLLSMSHRNFKSTFGSMFWSLSSLPIVLTTN